MDNANKGAFINRENGYKISLPETIIAILVNIRLQLLFLPDANLISCNSSKVVLRRVQVYSRSNSRVQSTV